MEQVLITTFTSIIPPYLILAADVFLSPCWEQRNAVLPHVLGRVVDRDKEVRRGGRGLDGGLGVCDRRTRTRDRRERHSR